MCRYQVPVGILISVLAAGDGVGAKCRCLVLVLVPGARTGALASAGRNPDIGVSGR